MVTFCILIGDLGRGTNPLDTVPNKNNEMIRMICRYTLQSLRFLSKN